ncbi:MAG: autotransporter-associated beta strand repeat-containing protein, partial [Akkermansiaceae bacterium]
AVGAARAEPLTSLNFDYQTGDTLGTNGWSLISSSGGVSTPVVAENLNYPDLTRGTGNAVQLRPNGQDWYKTYETQTYTTNSTASLYYSFLMRVDNLGTLNATGGYFAGLGNESGISLGATVAIRLAEGGFQLGIGKRDSTAIGSYSWDSTVFGLGATVLVAGSYNFTTGLVNNDTASLWLNPPATSFLGSSAPAPTLTTEPSGTNNDVLSFSSFVLKPQGNATSTQIPGSLIFDELRVGNTWADVTPRSNFWDGGGTDGSWANATNWSGNVVPAFTAQAVLTWAASPEVQSTYLGATRTIGGLIFGTEIEEDVSIRTTTTADGSTAADLVLQSSHGLATVNMGAGVTGDITIGVVGSGGRVVLGSSLAVTNDGLGLLTFGVELAEETAGRSLSKAGSGTMVLAAANTYSGATLVEAGTLVVTGSIATNSTVTVENSAILSGTGTVGPTVLNAGATIAPGLSPGTLTINGDLTWNGGANYDWEIFNLAEGPGSGWDLLLVSGELLMADLGPDNKFNINIFSLSGANTAGALSGFNASSDYSWTILQSSNLITGFNADYFNLNKAGFADYNVSSGLFSLALADDQQSLQLLYSGGQPIPEPATWVMAALLSLAGGVSILRRHCGQPSKTS